MLLLLADQHVLESGEGVQDNLTVYSHAGGQREDALHGARYLSRDLIRMYRQSAIPAIITSRTSPGPGAGRVTVTNDGFTAINSNGQ